MRTFLDEHVPADAGALAREAGLRLRYQEVMLPPKWTDGDSTWLYNLHVNALVDLPGNATQIVDFNLQDYDNNYPRRPLTESAGEARHPVVIDQT